MKRFLTCFLSILLLGFPANIQAQDSLTLPKSDSLPFNDIVIFGDSLSDVGNLANRTSSKFFFNYPGPIGNYDTGRFTDGSYTYPRAIKYHGVWHEQLNKLFLNRAQLTPSFSGGNDYAYGGATTGEGITTKTVIGSLTIDIDNMGKQINDYLTAHIASSQILYVVWGGGNDLLADASDPSAIATAQRIGGLISRLIDAGGRTFMIPNLPPIGQTPGTNGYSAALMSQLDSGSNVFSTELSAVLDQIESTYQGIQPPLRIFRLDVNNIYERLEQNPAAFGLVNIHDKAQFHWVDADSYLFWDGVHPTTAGHYWIGAEAYTLLTGIPILQAFPIQKHLLQNLEDKSGFYLTRTGSDLTDPIDVRYQVNGSAQEGTDYKTKNPSNHKTIPAGKSSVRITIQTVANPIRQAATANRNELKSDTQMTQKLEAPDVSLSLAPSRHYYLTPSTARSEVYLHQSLKEKEDAIDADKNQ